MNTDNLRFRSNRMRDIVALFHSELDPLYGAPEVASFVEMLCEAWLGWDRVQLLVNKESTINQSDLLRFHWALEDLRRHRPIQHIIGYTDFCGCRIEVNSNVLIPRPETDEMVRWIIAQGCYRHVLDLCTGSGCIAIALKNHLPHAEATAVDLSDAALAIARRNAQSNHTEVTFIQMDILDPDRLATLPAPFDLIVSNPPYVMQRERAAMSPNVLDYEPHQALFVPDADPLLFYRAIGRYAATHLAPGGLLAVEINQALGDETSQLLQTYGFDTRLHRDFRDNPRFITATRRPTV